MEKVSKCQYWFKFYYSSLARDKVKDELQVGFSVMSVTRGQHVRQFGFHVAKSRLVALDFVCFLPLLFTVYLES